MLPLYVLSSPPFLTVPRPLTWSPSCTNSDGDHALGTEQAPSHTQRGWVVTRGHPAVNSRMLSVHQAFSLQPHPRTSEPPEEITRMQTGKPGLTFQSHLLEAG